MSKPIIAVIGATGAQGGGLIRALLDDPRQRFAARAITRKPDGDKARDLAAAGAEVVSATLDDVDALAAGFAGAHGVFAVTNFWEHFSPETELRQARNLAEAARRAGVKHLIWSTLDDTRRWIPLDDARMPTLMGRYKVPHFDAKGEANAIFRELGVPATFLNTSFYWDNLIHFGMGPQRDEQGLFFLLPMGERKLPGIAAADIGHCALGIFARGESMIGRELGIAGEHLSGVEMAAALSKTLGQPVRHLDMPFAHYAALGFPGADDLANMFQFNHDFNDDFRASRPVEATRELHPGLLDFAGWLAQYGDRIPVPPAKQDA